MKHFKEHFSYDKEDNSRINSTFIPNRPEEDLTVQSYADEADINVMIKRFGIASVAKPQAPGYYDFTTAPTDYMEAHMAIIEADRRFAQVPARIRAQHENNPAKFAAWLADEKNADQARELGLMKPKPVPPAPMNVRVIPDDPKPSA